MVANSHFHTPTEKTCLEQKKKKKRKRKKVLYTQRYIVFRTVVLFCLNFNILFENNFVPVSNATSLHAPLSTYPQGARSFDQKALIYSHVLLKCWLVTNS